MSHNTTKREAGLELHHVMTHVLALRVYTISSSRSINDQLRQSPHVMPHSFAATLYSISNVLMACISTTLREVVEEFALSKSPLLFKLVTNSFMPHCADISFLSVHPSEKDVLYPP